MSDIFVIIVLSLSGQYISTVPVATHTAEECSQISYRLKYTVDTTVRNGKQFLCEKVLVNQEPPR